MQDPTVQKAQQVVSDLGSMLEAMREQQAEVEERVSSLQTAVQHLLPADQGGVRAITARSRRATPRAAVHDQGQRGGVLRGPAMRIGGAFNQTTQFLRDQVPRLLHATGDVASKAITAPVRFTHTQAGRLHRHYRSHTSQGTRVAVAYASGIGLAALASGVLTHRVAQRAAKRDSARTPASCQAIHAAEPSIDVVCGNDRKAQTDVEDAWAHHIILNSDGVFSSRSEGGDPSLVFAWPKLRVEWS
jgi:hypothetical protein